MCSIAVVQRMSMIQEVSQEGYEDPVTSAAGVRRRGVPGHERGRPACNLRKGRRAHSVPSLRGVPSRRRGRSHAAGHLQRGAPVGQGHPRESIGAHYAALAGGCGLRPFFERPPPHAEGDRHHRRLGGRGRARGRRSRPAAHAQIRAGLDHREARCSDFSAGRGRGSRRGSGSLSLYHHITVATNFAEDKWVQAAEIRPGNRAVVHHVIVFAADHAPRDRTSGENKGEGGRDWAGAKLAGFAPGEQPKVYPPGTAKLLKAGAKLLFQLHYTPNGKPATDRTSIGLIFTRGPIEHQALSGTATNFRFAIPPGDPNYEVRSSWTAPEDVRIVDLMPHMHVRGKDFTYTAVYPDGHSEIVLRVPKYNFNWQLVYLMQDPLLLPKGARLECVAHFDNPPNNPANPDPRKEVRWGPQTWEEMMIGWFDYTLDGPRLAAQQRNR